MSDAIQTNEILQKLFELAPETADQIITFGFISNFIGLGISILLIICSSIAAIYFNKKKSTLSYWMEDKYTYVIPFWSVCVLFVLISIFQIMKLLQITYTPNAYVIDQLIH